MAKADGADCGKQLTQTVWLSFHYEARRVPIVCSLLQPMQIDKLSSQAIRMEQVKVRSGESMRSPIVPPIDQKKRCNGSLSRGASQMVLTRLQRIKLLSIKST